MNVDERFILPPDVVIARVSELSAEDRDRLKANGDEFAVTRPRVRSSSKLVDERAADLLREFRDGMTITGAVASYAEARGLDPIEVLDAAYPLIRSLVRGYFLVPEASDAADRIRASLRRSEVVNGYEVLRCVRSLPDSEVYQVRSPAGEPAALKIVRDTDARHALRLLENEAELLRHVGGSAVPRLLDQGLFQQRPYLVLEWIEGLHPTVAADQIRGSAVSQRRDIWELCARVLEAYERLHGAGVVHGDVHAHNLLATRTGSVTILDLGYSHREGAYEAKIGRGTARAWVEPELAEARLQGDRAHASTVAGDQYSIAALLYRMVVGHPYLDLDAVRTEAMRQIVEDPPLSFGDWGAEPWPPAEAVFSRALAKRPADRYASIAELGAAWREVEPPARSVASAVARQRARLHAFVEAVIDRLVSTPVGSAPWATSPPTSSVNYGTGGMAYGLYRLACLREDPVLLAAADGWLTTAEARRREPDAFHNPAIGVTPEAAGRVSPYHSESGIHAVRALLGQAYASPSAIKHAVRKFVRASGRPCEVLDLTLGRASTLLGCTLLHSALVGASRETRDRLRACADEAFEELSAVVGSDRTLEEEHRLNVGISHGWAGVIYACLLWCREAGREPPAGTERRLDELLRNAELTERGTRWRRDVRIGSRKKNVYGSSWCNGPAGMVFLWTLAHEHFGDERYLAQAEGAAWYSWDVRDNAHTNLCCGTSGRGYALLNMYRATGEEAWLDRARELADRTVKAVGSLDPDPANPRAMSLWKGETGVALLAEETSRPDESAMPLFEPEVAAEDRTTPKGASAVGR